MSAAQGVGIVIVNWNSGDYLRRCLECIGRQTHRPGEVLVIDNDSRDGSLQRAQEGFESVTFKPLARNAGFAEANNIGVALLGDCEWVFLLNPDCFLEPDCLQQLLRAAAEQPGDAVFTPLLLQTGEARRIACAGDDYTRAGIAVHRAPAGPGGATAVPVFSGSAAALLLRRQLFLDAGGFDEDFFCYYEDVDLGFRLQLLGQRCLFVPGAVAQHVGGGTTGGSGNDFSLYYCQRNCIWTYVKNMPAPLSLRFLPLHLFAVLKNIAAGAARGRLWLLLRATGQALCGLPKMLRERRRIQAMKKVDAAHIDALLLRHG